MTVVPCCVRKGSAVTVRERLQALRTSPIGKLAPRSDRSEETVAQRVRDMTPVNTYQPPPPEEPEPEDP